MRTAKLRLPTGAKPLPAPRESSRLPEIPRRAPKMHPVRDMSSRPPQFTVKHPARSARVHVVIRIATLLALAAIVGSPLYSLLYLGLPALAALLISQKGAERYLSDNAPFLVSVLRWLAAAYAYLWLLTDEVPTKQAPPSVQLEIEIGGAPTTASALLRLLYSLPAFLVLLLLLLVAGILWVVGAIFILANERLPIAIGDFLTSTLRYGVRLAAYHASLVAAYPTFAESGVPHATSSGAA